MISYNPRHWFGIFKLHKTDTIRQLAPLIMFIAIYTLVVVLIETHVLHLSKGSYISNINIMHSLLGFVISMMLVFRTNSAYDRWWEGRKLWGSLTNNSRNLAIKLNTFLPPDAEKDRILFCKLIPMFAIYLRKHLQSSITQLELDDKPHPEIPDFDKHQHVPNQMVSVLWQRINNLHKHDKISGDQLIVINAEMQSFLDICGACERIKNTPIPYSYSAFIKKFIFLYVITLPFGFVFSLGFLAVPVVAFIFYVLVSLELIAEEIEDPFGNDDNDLPMEKMANNIKKNVEEIFA